MSFGIGNKISGYGSDIGRRSSRFGSGIDAKVSGYGKNIGQRASGYGYSSPSYNKYGPFKYE